MEGYDYDAFGVSLGETINFAADVSTLCKYATDDDPYSQRVFDDTFAGLAATLLDEHHRGLEPYREIIGDRPYACSMSLPSDIPAERFNSVLLGEVAGWS